MKEEGGEKYVAGERGGGGEDFVILPTLLSFVDLIIHVLCPMVKNDSGKRDGIGHVWIDGA